MRKSLIFWLGFGLLLLFELDSIYFIISFPGSQEVNRESTAYFTL